MLFQVVSQFCLSPLGPHEVASNNFLVTVGSFLVLIASADEALAFITMPLWASFNNLTDSGVIVSSANVEFEVGATDLRFYIFIFCI